MENTFTLNSEIFVLSDDKNKLDFSFILHSLRNSYWAKGIPEETVRKAMQHSICFGVYTSGRQIAYARVITDQATYAYLCDVIVDEIYRGKGIGKQLMRFIMDHGSVQNLRKFALATLDAHGLYKQFGFEAPQHPERLMEILKKDIYSRDNLA